LLLNGRYKRRNEAYIRLAVEKIKQETGSDILSAKIKPVIYPYHWDISGTAIPITDIKHSVMEYKKNWELYPLNKFVSDFPLHLDVEATGRCNLMCSYCFRYSRRTNVGDMSDSVFEKILAESRGSGLKSMSLSWLGEPLLHPDINKMIRRAKESGIAEVWIHTNGILVDEKASEDILDSGLDYIVFSVDAVTEETYNRLKYGSDFSLVNRNIEKLIETRNNRNQPYPRVYVQIVNMAQTNDELTAFVDYWRARANMVRVATYQSPDGKPKDRNRVLNSPKSLFPCPQLWQRLVIGWDGAVYACLGDNACRKPLGNISDTSIYDVWHGDDLNRMRELHSDYKADELDICSHCDANKIPESVKNYNRQHYCQ
jgi:radical SAM protein with 4Fe4S-binding SPASM domain